MSKLSGWRLEHVAGGKPTLIWYLPIDLSARNVLATVLTTNAWCEDSIQTATESAHTT